MDSTLRLFVRPRYPGRRWVTSAERLCRFDRLEITRDAGITQLC
jgi:hypothetical protein